MSLRLGRKQIKILKVVNGLEAARTPVLPIHQLCSQASIWLDQQLATILLRRFHGLSVIGQRLLMIAIRLEEVIFAQLLHVSTTQVDFGKAERRTLGQVPQWIKVTITLL